MELETGTNLLITVKATDCSVRDIDATITAVTEKAVKIENKRGFAWFPKSALVNLEQGRFFVSCEVAKWFRMNDFQVRMSETHGVLEYV